VLREIDNLFENVFADGLNCIVFVDTSYLKMQRMYFVNRLGRRTLKFLRFVLEMIYMTFCLMLQR